MPFSSRPCQSPLKTSSWPQRTQRASLSRNLTSVSSVSSLAKEVLPNDSDLFELCSGALDDVAPLGELALHVSGKLLRRALDRLHAERRVALDHIRCAH